MIANDAGTSGGGGADGFFGSIFSGIGAGIGKISEEILPVWIARELDLQERNQLYDPTYQGQYAPRRVEDAVWVPASGGQPAAGQGIGFQELAILGALVLGVVLIAR